MIQFRNAVTGEVTVLPKEVSLVELVSTDGKIATVFTTHQGTLKTITGRDPEALRYSKLFKVEFCPLVSIDLAEEKLK